MGPTGNTRIVQIHPTRKCNLSCRHCYSSSSPQASDTLEADVLKEALTDLAAEGYDWTSFSGGEPLVYDALPEVLEHAKTLRLQTTLVSNGMLLSNSRLDRIENNLDALVLSLDGKPESHNRMRNSPRAFEGMARNLEAIRKSGVKFGFLFTLTQHNLDELPWVVNFSLQAGASGLIIHPLENTGHAKARMKDSSPDSLESAHAWSLIEHYKTTLRGRLNLHLDLVHGKALELYPEQFFLGHQAGPLTGNLAHMLSVLVIEPDGEVVPLQYGFHRRFSLGNIKEQRITDMVENWRNHLGPELHELSSRLHATREREVNPGFINWYEEIGRFARQTSDSLHPLRRSTLKTSAAGAV